MVETMNPEAYPIVIPRWMLVVKYAMLALLGVLAVLSGIDTLDVLTRWSDYTAYWGMGIALFGGLAAAGASSRRFETLERWAGLGLVSLLVAYIAGSLIVAATTSFESRLVLSLILITLTMVPATRVGYLISRSGLPAEKRER